MFVSYRIVSRRVASHRGSCSTIFYLFGDDICFETETSNHMHWYTLYAYSIHTHTQRAPHSYVVWPLARSQYDCLTLANDIVSDECCATSECNEVYHCVDIQILTMTLSSSETEISNSKICWQRIFSVTIDDWSLHENHHEITRQK